MADPDLQIRGWGGGGGDVHPDPEIAGGLSQKHFFSALQASVRAKNKVGGGAGSPGHLPWISTRKTNLLLFRSPSLH